AARRRGETTQPEVQRTHGRHVVHESSRTRRSAGRDADGRPCLVPGIAESSARGKVADDARGICGNALWGITPVVQVHETGRTLVYLCLGRRSDKNEQQSTRAK